MKNYYSKKICEMFNYSELLTSETPQIINVIETIIKKELRYLLSIYGDSVDFTGLLFTNLLFLEKHNLLDFDLLNRAINWIEYNLGYDTDKSWFVKKEYLKFSDWFTRELTPEIYQKCKDNAKNSFICSPAEANLNSFGSVDNHIDIKNTFVHLNDGLLDIGLNLKNYFFLNFKLRRCFYHRVHSPIDGLIIDIKKYNCNETKLFGKNFGYILTIKNENNLFYLLIIGELSIQNFLLKVSVNQRIKKTQLIGPFLLGSQVILLLPQNVDYSANIEGKKYFVGDPLFK